MMSMNPMNSLNSVDLHLFSSPGGVIPSTYSLSSQTGGIDGASDPNSLEFLKANMHLVQNQITDVQQAARHVQSLIHSAYHQDNDPAITTMAIVRLRESIVMLADTLRDTGVGGLPADSTTPGTTSEDPANSSTPASAPMDVELGNTTPLQMPTEEQLLKFSEKQVLSLFEKLQSQQDAAGIVSSLLAQATVPRA